jgi:hypothetical protein
MARMVASPRPSSALALLAALVCAICLSGCRGCSSGPIVERKGKAPDIDDLDKKKKEKPKEDFEFKMPRVLPDSEDETRAFVKPGHWVTVRNLIKANNFDFQAELYTSATDNMGRPLRVENTDFQMTSSRPAPLPKGQEKAFDTDYFVPHLITASPLDLQPRSVWLSRELRAARGGRLIKEDVRQGTSPMPAYQYYFVTLADEPERYAFLKSLPSFVAYTSQYETDKLVYYRVVAPMIDRVAPLPNYALTWTSIAFVLWDDIPPGILTPLQQQALLDWLHWGGQLIISGPNSLEKLRGSFLDPYLPAKPGNSVPAADESLAEINARWSLVDRFTGRRQELTVGADKPLQVIELRPHEDAQYVPHSGRLVVERRIGSGRIVLTAFAMTDSLMLRWKCLDNFVNGAILRRPAREFRAVDGLPDTVWAGLPPQFVTDPRLVTTLRYFSRDVGIFPVSPGNFSANWEPGEAPRTDQAFMATVPAGTVSDRSVRTPVQPDVSARTGPWSAVLDPAQVSVTASDWHFRGFPSRQNMSMAAWNDRSGPSDAARESLRDASGISVPQGDFVLRVLAVYLAVLAPLNWLVFRIMGRVEWAWVAAPGIAILGTFAVVRMAQLDIGFARSMTEIAIAEMQGDYARAHVTRYTALYTSLSTNYDLEFADNGSLAQPFAASVERNPKQLLRSTVHEVSLRRDRQVRLAGFLVNSNTEGFVHCEQMVDMGGGFELLHHPAGGLQLRNGTRAALQLAGLFRRTLDGRLESSWIGDLAAKSTVRLDFAPHSREVLHFPMWENSAITASHSLQAQQLMDAHDADRDNAITRREATGDALLVDQFTRLDVNADRRLDRAELAKWFRQRSAGEVSLGSLVELAAQRLVLLPGEVRLIGCSADEIPGVSVRPAASQELRRTLFLVHLVSGKLPAPGPDLGLLSDVLVVRPENEGT